MMPGRGNASRRLRVALVASSLGLAGAEKQTVYTARALLHAGIDVRFFYLGGSGHYEAVLRHLGVSLCQIFAANRPWVILAGLTRALCRLRPHIVMASQFSDLLYGGAAGRFCNAMTLGGIRSNGFYELNAYGQRSRWMFRLAHGLIANSCRARQNLASRGINLRKIEVLPNVIDLRDFDSRSKLPARFSLPSDRIIVAAVGRLHSCKRFDRFLEALALARRSVPALAGIIAGADCGSKAALQEKASALGLVPPDITFLGEYDRVPALLAQAGLLVLSSEYEGFPNVILEAMAARLPVITTPAGDASLVVQHGKTGYVVEGEDTQGMAAFMVQLAQSPSMRVNFGETGRKRVEQEYSYESLPDRLMLILRRFASQQGRSGLVQILDHSVPVKETSLFSEALLFNEPAA